MVGGSRGCLSPYNRAVPVIDALGRAFDFPSPPTRVVSLVPSVTETLFDLGVGHTIVGITEFCVFPEKLERPRVGGTKSPDIEAIRALKPDLVHMNLEENIKRHARAIEAFAPVFVSEPKSVRDVVELIATLGAIHGAPARAADFVRDIESELTSMPKNPFTFACPIWKKPWMWCGGDTYVSDLVTCAGGENVMAGKKRYPVMTLDQLAALQPQIVFLPDEPYAFTAADGRAIEERSDCRTIGPFPGHFFTWHGTRTLKGLRFLRETMATGQQ